MIYANWLGIAVIGAALTQSEGRYLKKVESNLDSEAAAAASDRKLGNYNIPPYTCLIEAQWNLQRKKDDIQDIYYYVNDLWVYYKERPRLSFSFLLYNTEC